VRQLRLADAHILLGTAGSEKDRLTFECNIHNLEL